LKTNHPQINEGDKYSANTYYYSILECKR